MMHEELLYIKQIQQLKQEVALLKEGGMAGHMGFGDLALKDPRSTDQSEDDRDWRPDDNTLKVLQAYIDEVKATGRVMSVEEFVEDIENSIGWKEVVNDDKGNL